MASPLILADAHRQSPLEIALLRGPEINPTALGPAAPLDDPSRGCMYHHPGWLRVLQKGLRHEPYLLRATQDGQEVGCLPLAFMRSILFGRFLVSLPYVNTTGVAASDEAVGSALIGRAVHLADELNVRYLELRHERRWTHPSLNREVTGKMHMRLPLPTTAEELWTGLDPKVRNQIRKAQRNELSIHWGGGDLLGAFHAIFSRNMRDLGMPNFGRRLFQSVLEEFPDHAEICLVRQGREPVAAALLLHGPNMTEVPTASSLREFNSTNANMLMYWHLLQRAIARGQRKFDFGRGTPGSGAFRFKQQWGALGEPAIWHYYIRRGDVGAMRPDSPRNQRLIRVWRRLPVWLTRAIGPAIVRGIP